MQGPAGAFHSSDARRPAPTDAIPFTTAGRRFPRPGRRRFLALEPGFRESKESWKAVLLSLRERAVGDGGLGFWSALVEVYPETGRSAAGGAQDGERSRQAAQKRSGRSEADVV